MSNMRSNELIVASRLIPYQNFIGDNYQQTYEASYEEHWAGRILGYKMDLSNNNAACGRRREYVVFALCSYWAGE